MVKSPFDKCLWAIFAFKRVLFCYTDKSLDLCTGLNLKMVMKSLRRYLVAAVMPVVMSVSCEIVDDDPLKHVDEEHYVELSEVAQVFAGIPIQQSHLREVHDAVSSSSGNGYDEEYTMSRLFSDPGSGVGEEAQTRADERYDQPLRELLQEHLLATKSSAVIPDPQRWLDELESSDIQIYWPYSDSWDGTTFPVITFDPEDDSEVNTGYRLEVNEDGSREVRQVIVDEQMAMETPVWVINRNSDAGYKTLEMLRKEDPNWGNGGGNIVVRPMAASSKKSRSLILKDFRMNRNYDCWFAGASEFFVKVGSVEDFTATTEAELKLYTPKITDFLIVVKRGQEGQNVPFNAVLITDWDEDMTHCAFMIIEDDGGTWTEWKCTAFVRIASKSYGVELSIPIKSWDDIVWRGRLAWDWIEANDNEVSHFGDVDLTFEIEEY